jgi:hypothetical protein
LEPATVQDMVQTIRAFLNELFDNVQARQSRRPANSAVQRPGRAARAPAADRNVMPRKRKSGARDSHLPVS